MEFTKEQVECYNRDGFLIEEHLFSLEELEIINKAMSEVIKVPSEKRILEKNGSVRSFFAPESVHQVFDIVINLRKLVNRASQLLGGDPYVYQSKLNTKQGLVGDWWEWHQDYTFWKKDDGMKEPRVTTAMIFLNDVTEFNGPLYLIPGSHKANSENETRENPISDDPTIGSYQKSKFYMSALTTDLKYTLETESLKSWINSNGIYSAKGTAGSVLFFHGNIFHASPNNLSPWDRNCYLITYNHVENFFNEVANPRPVFISNRNAKRVSIQESDSLLNLKEGI